MPDAETPEYPPIIKGASFLLAWRLEGKKVLLIGGGLVASGRLYYLLEAGAHVTVVSPRKRLHPETAYRIDVSNPQDIIYLDRDYIGPEEDELNVADYDMVLTAIDEVGLSRRVCIACRKARVPVNVADVPPECDFYFGSQLRRGPLQIMVSTSGRGPKIASLIRKQIEASLPEDVEEAIDSVGKLRAELRQRAPGTGGKLGQKRMEWMIGICDAWRLDELGSMTPEVRTQLLDEGWNQNGRILSAKDVGMKSGVSGWWSDAKTKVVNTLAGGNAQVLQAGLVGFLLGAAIPGSIYAASLYQKRR
jgi:precorrin-2 dehydrogenase/sirohydrochlorin ferrochelatase